MANHFEECVADATVWAVAHDETPDVVVRAAKRSDTSRTEHDRLREEMGKCQTIVDLVRHAREQFGTRPFLSHPDASGWSFSFEEFDRVTDQVAQAFVDHYGVVQGDRVAVICSNDTLVVVAFFAIIKAGGIASMIHYTNSKECKQEQLERLQPKVIVTMEDVQASEEWPDQAHCSQVVTLESREFQDHLVLQDDEQVEKEFRWRAKSGDLICTFPTSGSTGTPKSVLHTHSSGLGAVLTSFDLYEYANMDFSKERAYLTSSKLSWVSGFISMTRSLALGERLYVSKTDYQVDTYWSNAARLGVTTIFGRSELLSDFLDLEGQEEVRWASTVKSASFGGSHVPAALVERAQKKYPGMLLCSVYGSTEGLFIFGVRHTATSDRYCVYEADSAFSTQMTRTVGLEYRIVDENRRPVGPGETGELVIRSKTVFSGYYGQPEKTEQVLVDGWYHTSDLVRETECSPGQKVVSIVGRVTDMIRVRGGKYQIEPNTIEQLVLAKFARRVKQCTVVGIISAKKGEEAVGFLELCPDLTGSDALAQEINDSIKSELQPWYAVERWHFLSQEEWPQTASGKVDKPALKKLVSLESTL